MMVAGKVEPLKVDKDKMEAAGWVFEDKDRVEEKMVGDRFVGGKTEEGRAEEDKEKWGSQEVPLRVCRVARIGSEA